MINDASVVIGGGNWGIKEADVLGYKLINGKYYARDIDFANSTTAGTYTDSTGVVRKAPYNLVTFSEMFTDSSWGKVASTITANTTTAPNGTLTADTWTGNGLSSPKYLLQTSPVVSGRIYYISVYAKKNTNNFIVVYAANATFGSNAYANFDLNNGVVGTVGAAATATIENAGNGWYRCIITATSTVTTTNVATAFGLITSATSPADEVNTLSTSVFLWGAQLVEGTSALNYFPTTTRLNVPRIDYRNADGSLSTAGRLLLEPQRTNSIRNSSMVGAVAGTPGTLPTNWLNLVTAGLTRTIVGTGTENGLPYVDIRFNGTANALSTRIDFEGSTNIAALTAQVWTNSIYSKIVSQPNPAVSYALQMLERTSGGGFVTDGSQIFTPTTSLQRFAFTRTLNGGATVANVQPCITINLTNGATYDFTIRIAAPQMELGAFATTWVPTTTATVTRNADTASRTNVAGWIGQTEGTLFVDLIANRTGVNQNIGLGDGTANNRIDLRLTLGNTFQLVISQAGAVVYNQSSATTFAQGQRIKMAAAYKSGALTNIYVNGVSVASATAGTITGNFSGIYTVSFGGSTDPLFSPITQALLFPTRLDNATLEQLTTL